MISFPISPAPSICDSLVDLEDLDEFLDAQGKLSRWPTPPLEKNAICTTVDTVDLDDEISDDNFLHIAQLLMQGSTGEGNPSPADVEVIESMLFRAQLPLEILALSLNILTELRCRSNDQHMLHTATPDLLVASALKLATIYLDDHPPPHAYWSKYICDSAWSARRIDENALCILGALDWRLHGLTSPRAIEAARIRLIPAIRSQAERHSLPSEANSGVDASSCMMQPPKHLKILVEGTPVCRTDGLLTPDETLSDVGFDD